MRTVSEVSKLTGVSIRALHYYDLIGLLHPAAVTESGYRLYDDAALERLQQILLFRELQFPLKEIKRILDSPAFDRDKALEQQIALLRLQKEHLEKLIALAGEIRWAGAKRLDFSAFDTKELDEYSSEVKAAWDGTQEYREYEEKSKDWTKADISRVYSGLMKVFADFGKLRDRQPFEKAVQEQVMRLCAYITEYFYTCTPETLSGLGKMYAAGGSMTENIDRAAGEGTAEFAAKAIGIYCKGRRKEEFGN